MKNGWETKKLGEVCAFINRGISPNYLTEGGICVLNQKCVRNHKILYEFSRRHNLHSKKVSPERLIQIGDVLVNSTGTGTLGRVAQVRENPQEPTTVDSHVTIVRPIPDLFHIDFFGYMLIKIEDELKEAGEGCGGQTELARSVLSEQFLVNFPFSTLEQRRIVAILDEAFEGIAVAKANAERNLQNARALFESYLESVFTERGDGWETRQLETLCRQITVGFVGSMAKHYRDSGIPFLRSQNIRPFEVTLENAVFISNEFHSMLKKSELRPGDLAIVRTGYPGTAAVIPPDFPECNCSDLVIVRTGKEINPHYLAAFFNSGYGKRLVSGKVVGAAQKHFNVTAAKEVVLNLPPLKKQENIFLEIDRLRIETLRLESIYRQKIAALDELKKSLLHGAFSGRL